MVQIQLRRGDSTSWAESNPVLAPGEAAVETDTGRMKVGDGLLPWTDLDYFPSSVDSDQVIGSIPPSQVTGTAVVQSRLVGSGTGLVGGGDLSTDRTLGIAAGGVGTTQLADDAVNAAKIAAGAVGNAEVAAGAGIDPSKIAGTAVVQTVATTKGDLPVRGASALERLPVGVAGTNPLLIPDTASATGVKWGTWADADVARASQVGNMLSVGMATSEDGVTVWRGASGSPVITNDNTYARTGTRSQKIVTTQISAIVSPTLGTSLSQRYAVTPGRRYTFATWVRANTADENWLARLYWYTATNAAASTATIDGPVGTVAVDGWTLVTVSAMAPTDAAVCSPAIVLSSGTVGAAIWADDASFHPGVGGYPSPPGQVVTGTQPSRSVVVTKDGINNTLSAAQPVVVNYGANVVWILPNAVDNYGVVFTLINRGTGTVTISRPATEPRTINGLAFAPAIPGHGQVQVVSTGDTWRVLSGEYTTNTVGKATYVWDHTANSTTASAWWRLVRYDSGQRSITLETPWNQLGAELYNAIQRQGNSVTLAIYADSGAAGKIYTVPAGFQPSPTTATCRWTATTGSAGGEVRYQHSDKTIQVYGYTSGNLMLSMTWPTAAALPTSLPGTEVTAPA